MMRLMTLRSCLFISVVAVGSLQAQDLEPRAYSISPVETNIAIVGYGRTSGGVIFDPTLPIEDVAASVNGLAIGYYRSMNFLGRSANVRASAPYAWGNMQGLLACQFAAITRSGLADGRAQFSVNLYGAPAMGIREFTQYRRKTNLSASIALWIPWGQYDPNKLINIGTNRWAFKPELAVSRAFGKWIAEGYTGVWFFSSNMHFYPGNSIRSQHPLGVYQAHLVYNFRRGLWGALDGTYYHGGRTTVDGVTNQDLQGNSRFGMTVSLPLPKYQSLKVSYARTASVRVGGKFETLSIGYAFTWFDH